MKKLAFNLNRYLLRGTQVAVFDYADYWEKIYGGESYIFGFENELMESYPKFKERFGDRALLYKKGDMNQLKSMLDERDIDTIYWIKSGEYDGFLCPNKRNLVHVVFQKNQPHGDKYVFIAEWLAERMSKNKDNHIPHIVKLPEITSDLREELSIPKDAVVFGRHGGQTEFNLGFVHKTVYDFAKDNPNKYFLFLNTNKFCPDLPNIIHLPGTWDMEYKTKFINTCDVLLHARNIGEIFSMTINEFLHQDKPIISWIGGNDIGHRVMLGDNGIWYNNGQELFNVLSNFKRTKPEGYYKKLIEPYTPENVMKRFVEKFEL